MNSNIKLAFQKCKKENRHALLTYTVAGDKNKKMSLNIINSISEHSDIIEWGFAHNCPIADGGQIQESSYRALKNGIKLNDIFRMIKEFKKLKNTKPLILMGYFNIIYQYGENNFLNKCKSSGVDGLIVVDLPWPENKEFSKKCKKKSICFVQLLSPTTTLERAKKILKDSHEMVYYISMLSTTGGKLKISPKKILANYSKIKKLNSNKNVVIGFGITNKTISSFKDADGLVVGSQIVKTISDSIKKGKNPVTKLNKMIYNLKRKII
jgi:tryptophan synthase alpha chain